MVRNPILLVMLALSLPGSESQAQYCPPTTPLRVGPDSIGYIPTQAPLRRVLALCPSAEPTWVGRVHVVPALALSFTGLTVVAWQNREQFVPDSGADMWVVRGAGGVLPGGVSTAAPWRELRKAYGPFAITRDGDSYQILPCPLPGLIFFVGDAEMFGDGIPSDAPPDAIADTTRIAEVWITAGVNRGHYLARGC